MTHQSSGRSQSPGEGPLLKDRFDRINIYSPACREFGRELLEQSLPCIQVMTPAPPPKASHRQQQTPPPARLASTETYVSQHSDQALSVAQGV